MKKSTYKEKIAELLDRGYTILEENDCDSPDVYLNFNNEAQWEYEVYGNNKEIISREEALRLLQVRQDVEEADTRREQDERKWLQEYYDSLSA
jgi:hypothetical protein